MKNRQPVRVTLAALAMAVTLLVGSSVSAEAATQDVGGNVNRNGSFTTYANQRTKEGYGNINMNITNNVQTTLVITLTRADGSVFTTERSFTGYPVRKDVATGVLAGTIFRIRARMYSAMPLGDNSWFSEPLTY